MRQRRIKPRPLYMGNGHSCEISLAPSGYVVFVDIENFPLFSDDCRKIAEWLIRAADYMETPNKRESNEKCTY